MCRAATSSRRPSCPRPSYAQWAPASAPARACRSSAAQRTCPRPPTRERSLRDSAHQSRPRRSAALGSSSRAHAIVRERRKAILVGGHGGRFDCKTDTSSVFLGSKSSSAFLWRVRVLLTLPSCALATASCSSCRGAGGAGGGGQTSCAPGTGWGGREGTGPSLRPPAAPWPWRPGAWRAPRP
jgi:hypothetical protein